MHTLAKVVLAAAGIPLSLAALEVLLRGYKYLLSWQVRRAKLDAKGYQAEKCERILRLREREQHKEEQNGNETEDY